MIAYRSTPKTSDSALRCQVASLWRPGRDTYDIAQTLGIGEARVYAILSEQREARRIRDGGAR